MIKIGNYTLQDNAVIKCANAEELAELAEIFEMCDLSVAQSMKSVIPNLHNLYYDINKAYDLDMLKASDKVDVISFQDFVSTLIDLDNVPQEVAELFVAEDVTEGFEEKLKELESDAHETHTWKGITYEQLVIGNFMYHERLEDETGLYSERLEIIKSK